MAPVQKDPGKAARAKKTFGKVAGSKARLCNVATAQWQREGLYKGTIRRPFAKKGKEKCILMIFCGC